ncbi:MAG TPA: NUDIX hydrolase [Blastocatellia bacterium]|nr:NUDIX hydrolase [Blastocatellia bacterium]
MMSDQKEEKLAAGGVVIDARNGVEPLALLVHRPQYDDWSFPKGGLDEGETFEQAALREVREETGIECRVVRPLASVRYRYRTRSGAERPKLVHYFLMEPTGGFPQPQEGEVDLVEWVPAKDALTRLSYERDREILEEVLKRNV